jgi:hypothetical protein
MMWDAIGLVSSGVTLTAFIVAVAAISYKNKLLVKANLIKSANEADRKDLVINALEFFHVDTSRLSKEQQYDIAMEQIWAKTKRFKHIVSVLCLIIVSGSFVAIYALSKNSEPIDLSAKSILTPDTSPSNQATPTVTHSMINLREMIETNLSTCWQDRASACEMAAESVTKYCSRVSNGEDPIRNVPDDYCPDLSTVLLSLASKLKIQDPSCLATMANSCSDVTDDVHRSHCFNRQASCQGLIYQIVALRNNAQSKSGIIHFTIPST